jgi:hypothetical protein
MTGNKKSTAGICEECNFYTYDDDYECYTCEQDLDEDEMARFLADEFRDCPYYQPGNEYLVVRKQM